MAEYIERSYIRKMAMFEMAYTMETETDAAVVLRMIDDAPAADVAPVVHGHFVHDGPRFAGGVDWWRCSACGGLVSGAETQFAYCPNCGAIMDGGDNNAAD
jgi:rubrerythrin